MYSIESWCGKMKNKFKTTLQVAVLLSCTTLFPWQAMAEDSSGEYIQNFTYDGKTYFDAVVLSPGQDIEIGFTRELEAYEIKSFEEQALVYLGNITGKPKDLAPMIVLYPTDIKDFNASAYSPIDEDTANTYYGNYFIDSGVPSDTQREPIASITIDAAIDGYAWYTDEYPILPLNGLDSDYPGAVVHEMIHAMGVGAYNIIGVDNGDAFWVEYDLKYTDGLYDAFGRKLTTLTATGGELLIKSIAKAEYESLKNSNAAQNNVFYVIKDKEVGSNGGVYFSGENVQAVLGAGTNIAWPDEVNVAPVPGIPINCYEGNYLELSHLELQNSLMSHQAYRNWCTLMEAEMALLQDLGFDVAREKFFGQSVYASGETNAKNVVGISDLANGSQNSWSSDTDRAIGLHVYGSYNNVTLNSGADITANGSYSMGVRIDGVGNDLKISSDLKVGNEDTDKYNYGISVNYGKEHNVTIETGASVVAQGEESIGAIFDFGSNELSDTIEYRGSYIRGEWSNKLDSFKNYDGDLLTVNGALAGALVEEFNVNGTLQGEKAIYISPNALVKEINIAGNDTNDTFEVKGDIISEWNPEGVEYFYTRDYGGENPYKGLKPNIILSAGETLDDYRTNLNFNGDRTFTDNIIGPYGLIMNVKSGNLTTSNANNENSSYVNVHSVNVGNDNADATYTVKNILMADCGYGSINVMEKGNLKLEEDANGIGTILIAFNDEDDDGQITFGIINNEGKINFTQGELALKPDGVYFDENTTVKILESATDNDNDLVDGEKFGAIWFVDMNGQKAEVAESNNVSRASTGNDSYKVTKTLTMTAEQGSGNESNIVSITTERSFKDVELGKDEATISNVIENVDSNIKNLADNREANWKEMLAAIDFMKADGEINNALGQLLPSSYGYGAMATMDLHRMLSDFAVGGSLAPATNVKEEGQWHNIVIPYASETDHIKNGSGYKNNHAGMVGAMERTLDDVTLGWHAALNHQSTTGAKAGSLKGNGLYLGAQVKYAPESWKGWSTFGIARLGVEDFEMKRKFNFNGYAGKADSDFTAFSGNVRVGGAFEKEAKSMSFGPFMALDYAFAHHPSISEKGNSAGVFSVERGTYDSLRTQLGYRVQTAPKHLEDRTYWQANAAIAWNYELLGDAGSVSASFRDFDGSSFDCDVDNYGRDSFSLMAGVTFKNPTKLDVTLNLGTDIYRHGGNTLYAKCALEWKF